MYPMGAQVRAALARIPSGYNKEEGEEKGERERNLVTLNLLGGCPIGVGSGDLDLYFRRVSLPGLGNRCDLLSDKMQPQKPSPAPARRELQDLNLPPAPEAAGNGGDAPPVEDSASLNLHAVTSAASGYPSICTLENVKSALVRAERESRDKARTDGSPSSSWSSAATNSSMKRRRVEEGGGSEEGAVDGSDSSGGTSLMAAGCPSCLLYVLVAKREPRCPRCGSHVPALAFYKKPRVFF